MFERTPGTLVMLLWRGTHHAVLGELSSRRRRPPNGKYINGSWEFVRGD